MIQIISLVMIYHTQQVLVGMMYINIQIILVIDVVYIQLNIVNLMVVHMQLKMKLKKELRS